MTLFRLRLPASLLLAPAFAAAAGAAAVFGRVAAGDRAAVGLWGYCALALLVGTRALTARAALVVGPVCWLFLDGFVEHRDGMLGWGGGAEAARLALLTAAALAPAAARRFSAACSAGRRFRRVSVAPFEPVQPPPGHPSAWN